MESRVARIESDVSHLKDTVAAMQVDMRTMRDDISGLRSGQVALSGRIDQLHFQLDARMSALETRLIKWLVGTAIAATSAGVSIAKLLG